MSSDLACPVRKRQLYGRRQSRPLNTRQHELWENLLPAFLFNSESFKRLSSNQKISFCLEIGFGSGEHLYQQALAHPHHFYIGCEPFVNGVAALLQQLDRQPLKNIMIMPDDAGLLLAQLPEACLEQVFLLFADPWPKKRHHKRRFVQQKHLVDIYRVLKPGGTWRIATDHPGYQEWILRVFSQPSAQQMFSPIQQDKGQRPDWPITRYEQKAIQEGRSCLYVTYQKKDL